MVDIFTVSRRPLRDIPSYVDFTKKDLPAGAPRPELEHGEDPYGAYVNDAETFSDLVFFSTRAVYVFRLGGWDRAPWAEVLRTDGPRSKVDVTGFTLLLRDRRFWLPVTGFQPRPEGGCFYDAFGILRFVNRVVGDFARRGREGTR